MVMKNSIGRLGMLAALLLGSTATVTAQGVPGDRAQPPQDRGAIVWDARAVEHLMNRAGFGARTSEIEAGVAMGAAAFVDRLVSVRTEVEPFFYERIGPPNPAELKKLDPEARRLAVREVREKDRKQLLDYTSWWLDRMADGRDPLLERMVLFWHGFFTTSFEDVRRSWIVIQQNQLVREKALGSYADLLRAMSKDAALLTYLDNQVNRKGNPNENFARELMELFSLGEGHYSEADVKDAARALTGRGVNREGAYEFHKRVHDDGEKTILGESGRLDGGDLVRILLDQEACPRHVAGRLLRYFEGVEPDPGRLDDYARFLRAHEYRMQPFLRRLFLDPAFYREEVVGARVQGPVDYLVGITRRLGVEVPSSVLGSGTTLLGQRLFWPPSVKGWEGGVSWITTASIMQRGNLAGFMLGLVRVEDVLSEAETREPPPRAEPAMDDGSMAGGMTDEPAGGDDSMKDERSRTAAGAARAKRASKGIGFAGSALYGLRRAESSGWTVTINLTARMRKSDARTDAEIADRMLEDLLAIHAPEETRALVRAFLARERGRLRVADGELLDVGAEAERVLRRLAHLIYSLPEAQLC